MLQPKLAMMPRLLRLLQPHCRVATRNTDDVGHGGRTATAWAAAFEVGGHSDRPRITGMTEAPRRAVAAEAVMAC